MLKLIKIYIMEYYLVADIFTLAIFWTIGLLLGANVNILAISSLTLPPYSIIRIAWKDKNEL